MLGKIVILKKVLISQMALLFFFSAYPFAASKDSLHSKGGRDVINCYKKLAEAGDANAMNNLGAMYWRGNRVKQDCKLAEKYFKQAAEAGDTNAKNNLSIMKRQRY